MSLYFVLILPDLLFAQSPPIRPERKIRFSTSVGSFMSVSVSPQGDSLAFDLLGDIYVMAATGGVARHVTGGMAMHRNPYWSVDGKAILCEKDSSRPFLWGGGRLRDTVLSKDNRWRVFLSNRELMATNDSFKTQKTILKYQETSQPRFFSISPDSRFVYTSYEGKIHRIDLHTLADIVIPFNAEVGVDAGKLNYHQFRVSQDSFAIKYARSANIRSDNNQIVFAALNRIYMKDLPNGKPRLLTRQNANQFQPVYSPDGRWVGYVTWNDSIGGALWRIPSGGGKPEQLSVSPGQFQRPAWSPDGKSIAVLKGEAKLGDRDNAGKGVLVIIVVNSKAETVIAENVPMWNTIAFSANGKRIHYVPGNRTGRQQPPQLVAQHIATKTLDTLVIGNLDFSLPQLQYQYRISRDSRYLVFGVGEDLYFLGRSPNQPFDVTIKSNTPMLRFGSGVDPYWSKDGKSLHWTCGHTCYTISLSTLIKALPTEGGLVTNMLPTEQDINLDIVAPVLTGKGLLALTNARLITMNGDEVIEQGCILIRDGRIVTVGRMTDVSLPTHAKRIDLKGKTVIPGLIDLHCHMRVPSEVYPQQSWMMKANLAYGVTTARDPSSSFDSYGYAELIETGQMIGPRLFTVGRSVNPAFGLKVQCLEDARLIVAKRKQLGSIAIKQYVLPARQQQQWLLQAVEEAELNMTNEGPKSVMEQLAMLKDGSSGIEHSPEWGEVYEDIIEFYAKSGTWLTPCLNLDYGSSGSKNYFNYNFWRHAGHRLDRFTFSDPTQDRPKPTSNGAETLQTIRLAKKPEDNDNAGFLKAAKICAAIYHKGGRIGMGSHGNNPGIGAHNEIWALQMGGLTNMEALKIATIHGAEALGMQRDLGSLEPGKIADLLILENNPLENIRHTSSIAYIMKNGVLYDGDTMEKIGPAEKKR